MIKEYLNENITIVDSVDSWEESIRIAAKNLLEKDYITSNYVDSMINNVMENGPYVIIIPGVAMPHSRPDEGVNRNSLSLLKLNEPVSYPKGKNVNLILVLAAKDNDSHMDLIVELSELLSDQNKINRIIDSKTVEEIISIL